MGKNNVNKRFTVDLEISTGDAEKQVKASAENIKKILSSAIEDGIGTKELRKMAETINAMFTGLGKTAPLNIDENFTGKGKTAERVKILSNELNNLFDILGKINTTSSTSGNVLGGVNNEAQAEIDKLEEQSRRYQSIIDTFNQVSKMKIAWDDGDKIELDIEATEESAKKLIDRFNQLNDVINEGNLDDIAYADALANRAKAALQLIEINERLTKTNKDGEVIKESPKFLRDFLAMNDDGESLSQYALEDFEYEAPEIISKLKNSVSEVTQQMENLRNTTEAALSGVDSIAKGSSIGNKVDDIGKAAESSKEKVDALKNSIKEVFMSSAQIEVDTRSGKLNGNETMSLFEANGNVSTVHGTDYQVDTDALVQQAIANLNKNIVMSLHNHANGDMTFSPSDINSFAKLYYGQGTKINGIIANGVIQTIDFNNISQEVAVKIAQDYQEGVKHFFDSELVSQFASLQSGEIIPTDMLKRLQINDPKQYQEVINTIQEGTMATLRQAFENNGAEFTLQSFDVDNIEKLTEYLHKAQQGAQGTIEPVEKLKNLITTLNPNETFDWNQFTDIFNKFKSGAIDGTQALNQILDFKTVAADVNAATVSIEQTEAKLKEFLALTEEIRTKNFDYYGNAEDNVEVGKYTERLTTAKAALDELGDQGLLTAEQLNQVQEAFNRANSNLNLSISHYSGYGDGYYDYSYYDEYKEQQNRADDLEAQNRDLQEQLNNAQKTSTEQNQNAQYSAEIAQLDQLKEKLAEVKTAIDLKTQAFEEEYITVDAAVDAEVQSLQLLLQQLQDVLNTIGLINQAFTQANESIAQLYGTKDIDIKEDTTSNAAVEKSKEIINKQYALDSTVASTNKILGDILAAINKEKDPGVQKELETLISALTANINTLKDATNGVIDHQKAQKTDTTKAMARIQDSTQYKQISSIAENSIGDLGTDVHIKSLKALANGLVGVEGAFKDVNGEWEGFTVKVNESNNAVDLAINKQSAFAKVMRKLDEEMERMTKASADANDRKLPPEATATSAIIKAQDYDDDGKEVTVQYKDSQRYTVSLKENIGGLQKEVFQTFDDSIKDFNERTTVTISNKTAAAIRDTNKLISENTKDVANANLLREYNDEYGKLLQMNQRYRSMDDLGDDDIDTWNSQITLVQNLGNQITGLIKQQQRLENEKGVATSAKRLQEYQSNVDKIFRELNFGLNEAKTPAQNQIVGIYDQIIEKVNALKKSHSVLTDQQTQEINTLVDSLKKEADAYKSTIDSVFKSDRDKKLSKFDLDQATLEKDINTSSFSDEINNARNAIANAANADSLKIAINGWEELQNKIKAAAIQQDLYYKKAKDTGTKPDKFTKDLGKQKTDFAQYKQEVENATGVTDELKGKLVELENQLNSVGDADGLAKWVQSFKNVANEIKSSRGKIATEIVGKANSKFREVDFKADSNNLTSEQQAIVDKRKELLKQISEYNAKVNSSQKAEISGIEATRDALYNLIDAYKKKYNIENAGGSATKKAYGTAQLQNFTGKYNDLMNRARSVGLNSDFEAVQKLTAAYQELRDVQAEFKVGEDTKSGVGAVKVEDFKQAQIECNRYAQELAKIIAAEEKLRADSESSGGKSAPVAEDFDVSIKGRAQALEDFVRVTYGASVSIGKFNDDVTKLSFVVKNGDGTITNMTASLNAARTAIYATAGGTEKATTSFGRFFDELKAKARGITTYLLSMTGFQEIWQQVRQGVQYVREIDSALTELRKVTNETEASYKQFLQTASQVSSVIGSNVADFTNATADFARLGYNLQQATELAKAASVYKNVGDGIENISQASESIISTMKAFGIEADNAMGIVDRFNAVGNSFAISSTGIGEAMQRSASALFEAGNTIDESIALITGANSVVQNPEQVGEMLADYKVA